MRMLVIAGGKLGYLVGSVGRRVVCGAGVVVVVVVLVVVVAGVVALVVLGAVDGRVGRK